MQCCRCPGFSLRFEPLVEGERVIDIPCDASGQVDLDALSEADRNAYLYARVVRHGRFTSRVVPLHND
jgi:hypothetical protein